MVIQEEGYNGVGKKERQRLKRQWKAEGKGLSLKEWARKKGVGDAAYVWVEHKKET